MLHCPGTEKAAVVTKMSLTLSADHRIFDGQVGGIDHLSPVISFYFLSCYLLSSFCDTWQASFSQSWH
jgi:hypothetical protein